MSAISDIREKEFSTWTPEQNCFVEIWETNGLEDLAEKASTNYAAMQARIEKLEVALAGDYCPSCTWRGNVTLVHGVCPYCEVDWVELKIKENEEE